MAYQKMIAPLAPGYDPNVIEAWMRVERGTLDHLSPEQFGQAVREAVLCAREAGPDQNKALLESMGM